MFQIASTIGIALQNGHEYAFSEWINHDNKAFGNEDVDVQRFFREPLPLLDSSIDVAEVIVPWGYHEVKLPAGNFALNGYLQSEKYFSHCKETVRRFLTPKRLVKNPLGPGTCAVHVRLGDYDGAMLRRLGIEYYHRAMALMPDGTQFVIFSDEPDKAINLFGSGVEVACGNHYMADFYMMSTASHNIIGNSSYSWWAAWLNPNPSKMVVAPSVWFGPKNQISAEDIYCEDWIVV